VRKISLRCILALSSFCVVATTLGNSWMAGRNFSCKSQMLGYREHVHMRRNAGVETYKSAGFAVVL
jgi:hypothetical protein